MRPMAAAVASDEPQTAAKPEQAKTEEIASAPGMRRRTALAASKRPVVRPAWKATNPISRNIGTAESVQLATKENGVLDRMPMAGVQPSSQATPPKDTAISASATGTRRPAAASGPRRPRSRSHAHVGLLCLRVDDPDQYDQESQREAERQQEERRPGRYPHVLRHDEGAGGGACRALCQGHPGKRAVDEGGEHRDEPVRPGERRRARADGRSPRPAPCRRRARPRRAE